MMFFSLPSLCLSLPTFSNDDAISNLNWGRRLCWLSRCKQMVHCIMPLHFHVHKKISNEKYHIFTNDISWTNITRTNVVNFSQLSPGKYESIYDDKIIFIGAMKYFYPAPHRAASK